MLNEVTNSEVNQQPKAYKHEVTNKKNEYVLFYHPHGAGHCHKRLS